ncbi:MAG: hypothetical protein ABIJ52_00575, partial [Pseudomonadota bacterium]
RRIAGQGLIEQGFGFVQAFGDDINPAQCGERGGGCRIEFDAFQIMFFCLVKFPLDIADISEDEVNLSKFSIS